MHDLVDSVRRAPTPETFHSRTLLVEAIKRAHVAMVRMSIGDPDVARHDAELVTLRDYALWLEGVAMERVEETEDYCALAATIYEFTGTLTRAGGETNIFVSPLNDLVRSAILSGFTAFQAQSTLIAQRVLAQLRSYTPRTPLDRCNVVTALAITALLAREFSVRTYAVER